jgi:hypothetical protein
MGRFETKWLSRPENLAALANLPGQWMSSTMILGGRRVCTLSIPSRDLLSLSRDIEARNARHRPRRFRRWNPVADRPPARAASSGMGAMEKMQQATPEVRSDAGRSTGFGAVNWRHSPAHTQHAICGCASYPKGRSL